MSLFLRICFGDVCLHDFTRVTSFSTCHSLTSQCNVYKQASEISRVFFTLQHCSGKGLNMLNCGVRDIWFTEGSFIDCLWEDTDTNVMIDTENQTFQRNIT